MAVSEIDKRRIAEDILMKNGISPGLAGFNCLVLAMLKHGEGPFDELKISSLYHELAKELGATYGAVERRIRHAVETIKIRKIDSPMYDFIDRRDYRITNSEFLGYVFLMYRRAIEDVKSDKSHKYKGKTL